MLYFTAKIGDVGNYVELVQIKGKDGITQLVPLKIKVLPPIKDTQCPFGNKPMDCFPKIKEISNEGVLTLFFPIPLASSLNETLFNNASKTLYIKLD